MRVAVLYRTTEGPWGGGNSFLRALARQWRADGIEVVHRLDAGLDGVLINSAYLGTTARLHPDEVKRMIEYGSARPWLRRIGWSRWRRQGTRPPFVHRLDGVFRLYGRPPGDPADLDQARINRLVDWTIYQSEFCRSSFAAEGLTVRASSVIVNGVELDVFRPADRTPPFGPLKLVAVAWSPNRKKGAPAAVAASRNTDVEVTFVGNWPPGLERERVKVMPPLPHAALADELRRHHAMLHMAENEPCSNAILEAIACGLPVIYHPSGGNPEIVGACGIACTCGLEEALTELRDRYTELREAALARRPDLSIERAAQEYAAVFRGLGPVATG